MWTNFSGTWILYRNWWTHIGTDKQKNVQVPQVLLELYRNWWLCKNKKKTVHVKLSKSCTVFSGKTDANDQSMQMKISLQINRPPLLLIIQDTVAWSSVCWKIFSAPHQFYIRSTCITGIKVQKSVSLIYQCTTWEPDQDCRHAYMLYILYRFRKKRTIHFIQVLQVQFCCCWENEENLKKKLHIYSGSEGHNMQLLKLQTWNFIHVVLSFTSGHWEAWTLRNLNVSYMLSYTQPV
jgi:hypothetical protein